MKKIYTEGLPFDPRECLLGAGGGDSMNAPADFFDTRSRDWQSRLSVTVEMMRELSKVRDPQSMNQIYARRMLELFPTNRRITLSRRHLVPPQVRITRSSTWQEQPDASRELPVLSGGIFADLLYSDQPRIIDDLRIGVNDPAREYLAGQRSLLAIPLYDDGVSQSMVVATRSEPYAFVPDRFPDLVWMSNLFNRATQTAVLSQQLEETNQSIEREMKKVARMQRSLLPATLPTIPTVDLAVHYQSLSQAGGDYYDFLPLPKGRWGFLIADVSGHGAAAAVLMAITHSLTKTYTGPPWPPGLLLAYLNRHLAEHYTSAFGSFVTAFYAVYDPDRGAFQFANAGHPPPRLVRAATSPCEPLEGHCKLPLGISDHEQYPDEIITLAPGDKVVFYTDGITDAPNGEGEPFGSDRLDAALQVSVGGCQDTVSRVLAERVRHTNGTPNVDDRTLMVARFVPAGTKTFNE